ncbi:MAG: DUF4276 family protein [Planctomycetes bacterium]|nr:DUF4276 family protein [Planctomycetota bacterium]
MRIRVLVEGRSEQRLLELWGPRAFPKHELIVHPHQGKGEIPGDPAAKPDGRHRGLLDQLPATLRAFAGEPDTAVLVLVDADNEDCRTLKKRLLTMVARVRPKPERLMFRIAVEETEAFYLGDLRGLKKAYPQANMRKARSYRPDSICGTAELFGLVVQDDGLNKVAWAEAMGAVLTIRPEGSRSPSFRALHQALVVLTTERVPAPTKAAPKKRAKHWKSRYSSLRKQTDK